MTEMLFLENLNQVRSRIQEACRLASREASSVELLPVTKTHPSAVVEWVARAGLGSVGENRVQEALEKRAELVASRASMAGSVRWELIGHLQTNKARAAAEHFDRVQSVDSLRLAEKLHKACESLSRPILPVLLQINSGEDPAKFGASCDEAQRFLEGVLQLPHLKVDGLMTIAPLDSNPDTARRCFSSLRELRDRLSQASGLSLSVLSMGMSGDLTEAILEGSTQIRVGSSLFGHR